MKSAVVTFPASNCNRDMFDALEKITGQTPHQIWHQDTEIPDVDLIALPGGFSFGDYLRCGAMCLQWFSGSDRNGTASRRTYEKRIAQVRL